MQQQQKRTRAKWRTIEDMRRIYFSPPSFTFNRILRRSMSRTMAQENIYIYIFHFHK